MGPKDYTGRRVGIITVVLLVGTSPRRWHCRCDCGNQFVTTAQALCRKYSCGCCTRPPKAGPHWKHLMCGTKTYRTWSGVVQRCTNPNSHRWKDYGGRGIRVCGRMRTFVGFLSVLGLKPEEKSIDRIDNEGHYSCGECPSCIEQGWPRNVRWATTAEQATNKRKRSA